MKLAVYLVLILASSGRGDGLTVFPKPFASVADCRAAGTQWKERARGWPEFTCLEIMESVKP